MKESAGLLMYRVGDRGVEVFLVHPGGPFFARRDAGVWSIPKGLFDDGEEPLEAACREFAEETGREVEDCRSRGVFLDLGSVVQRGGKQVTAWAFEGDWPEGEALRSNTFALEWPPGSGRQQRFPEVDGGRFFAIAEARERINPAQSDLLDRLLDRLERPGVGS